MKALPRTSCAKAFLGSSASTARRIGSASANRRSRTALLAALQPVEERDHILGIAANLIGPGARRLSRSADVTQGGQPLLRVAVECSSRHHALVTSGQLVECAPHRFGRPLLLLVHVVPLAGIVGEVVQLGLRSVDELPALVAKASERRPVQVELRQIRLRV